MTIKRTGTYAIIGADARGARVYAEYLKNHPQEGNIVTKPEICERYKYHSNKILRRSNNVQLLHK